MQPADRAKIVVLVDGGRTFCDTVERAFRAARPGTVVFTHADGQRAIEYLALCGQRYPMPDLVLLNRVLPDDGPDGWGVLRAIRARESLAALPVILIGSDGEPGCTEAAVAAGAEGFLLKPTDAPDYPELARAVFAWCDAREGAELLHTSCTALTAGSSPSVGAALGLPATMPAALSLSPSTSPAASENPMTQFHGLIQALFGYVAGGNALETVGLFADRKLVEITRSCRMEGIEEEDALDRSQDPVLVLKRGRVIRRLMTLEWADTELIRRFKLSRSTIKELRRLWRQETAKSRTVVGRVLN